MKIYLCQPEWVQALAAVAAALIALPGMIWAVLILIKRDKAKEVKIRELTKIAETMNAQNEILNEGNSLLGEQVEVLRKVFVSRSGVSEGNDKLAAIEERKFLLSIRPRLFSNGGPLRYNEVNFDIENLGEDAIIQLITDIAAEKKLVILNQSVNGFDVSKGKSFRIATTTISGKKWDAEPIEHRFEIRYSDKEGNLYKQEIYGVVGKSYMTTKPELIK